MTSKEIADMIFTLKDKLTDKEFKDIMEKLSIKNKEEQEEQEDIYEVRYIKQKRKLTHREGGMYYKIEPKYKIKKVKLYPNCINLKDIIDEIIEGMSKDKTFRIPTFEIIKKNGEYFIRPADEDIIWCNNPYDDKGLCKCGNCDDDDDDDDERAKEKGAFIGFREMLIIDIKKI